MKKKLLLVMLISAVSLCASRSNQREDRSLSGASQNARRRSQQILRRAAGSQPDQLEVGSLDPEAEADPLSESEDGRVRTPVHRFAEGQPTPPASPVGLRRIRRLPLDSAMLFGAILDDLSLDEGLSSDEDRSNEGRIQAFQMFIRQRRLRDTLDNHMHENG